jgi:hypothetical protein
LIENQPPCVKEIDVCGCNKIIQLQSYQKGDSIDYIECDGLTTLSEENRVLTTKVLKDSICSANENKESTSSIMVNKSTDPACNQVKLKVNDGYQESINGLYYLLRKLGIHPRNVKRIFYSTFMASDCLSS